MVAVELCIRFVVGGALVSLFALLGDTFSPKSFAGLFAGAPSVALASLVLTLHRNGAAYAALEARSMVLGAAAFVVYSACLSAFLHRRRLPPALAAAVWLPLWFMLAVGAFALVGQRS
jgi:uncharacterized membrane protein (GlpM family)